MPHEVTVIDMAPKDIATITISGLGFIVSIIALIRSYLADSRARKSVRPYISTGIHVGSEDMSVSLANYGMGLAIIDKITFSRDALKSTKALAPLLSSSSNLKIGGGVNFVQKEYHLRPGDHLPLASGIVLDESKLTDALRDWENTLEGVTVTVEYRDIYDKRLRPYTRTLSARV